MDNTVEYVSKKRPICRVKKTGSVLYIPKSHIKKIVAQFLKIGSSNVDVNNKQFKMDKKARNILHSETEAFLIDIFSLCKNVQDISKSIILKKKTFQFCSKLKSSTVLSS
jgi:hypothetical protein